jgi:hypothetical protein
MGLQDRSLGIKYSRMVFFSRILVKSVQIDSFGIRTPVASSYTIWVEARDDFKYKPIK